MSKQPYWRYTGDPELADYTCKLCGAQADTVHFFPDYKDPEGPIDAVLACKDHDPGGRWYFLRDLLEPEVRGEYHTLDHIQGKTWRLSAFAAFYDLVDDIRHEIAMRGRGE